MTPMRIGPLLPGLLLCLAPSARADEAAARALAQVRDAYRSGPVREHLTIEVRGQDGSAEISEGTLHLDLRPEADCPIDLTLGPIRAAVVADRLVILHATEPDRYVGVHLESLTFAALSRTMPLLPLPQLALVMPDAESELSDDQIALDPLLPATTLREVARGPSSITLAGRRGTVTATLTINDATRRIERFEATIPAPSGWYELILTCADAGDTDGAPARLPDLSARTSVDRVADLRPRGLVLVTGAELGWVPIWLVDPGQPTTLAAVLSSQDATVPVTPLLLGMVEMTEDRSWIDAVRITVDLLRAVRAEGPSLLLVFDPAGRRSSRAAAVGALVDLDLGSTRVAWVDGRTLPLGRSLPRLDPAVIVVSDDGLILATSTASEDAADSTEAATRLRAALGVQP